MAYLSEESVESYLRLLRLWFDASWSKWIIEDFVVTDDPLAPANTFSLLHKLFFIFVEVVIGKHPGRQEALCERTSNTPSPSEVMVNTDLKKKITDLLFRFVHRSKTTLFFGVCMCLCVYPCVCVCVLY